ncbi:hypothetical protein [Curtobacterium sp. MCBD17_040]|uniref:hypothetical protein n=1 Tax=Curtobacterium sp. MCBD17_040 TaxID=2175674 RepID=UPI0011B57233|nr:hypothetical protein [Curtobacterium sp. MCBD17_040]WIB65489.1 hypothetical protein DEI94_19135 [Curtobacterium sp. MCBD17_040]
MSQNLSWRQRNAVVSEGPQPHADGNHLPVAEGRVYLNAVVAVPNKSWLVEVPRSLLERVVRAGATSVPKKVPRGLQRRCNLVRIDEARESVPGSVPRQLFRERPLPRKERLYRSEGVLEDGDACVTFVGQVGGAVPASAEREPLRFRADAAPVEVVVRVVAGAKVIADASTARTSRILTSTSSATRRSSEPAVAHQLPPDIPAAA